MSRHFLPPKRRSRVLGLALAFLSVFSATSSAQPQIVPAPKPGQQRAAPSPAPTAATAKNTPRYDIAQLCDALVSQNQFTLIPKRAVLFASPERQQAIRTTPGSAQFQQWTKFLGSNLSWISTYEVTLEQARGITPISPEVMKTIKQRGGVVVAVYRGSPISIATPAAPGAQVADTKKPNAR